MLEIVYRDEYFVAINKPAGLLVHRSNIDRQETRFAVQLLRDQLGRHVHPVHRLDKPVSGILLFALERAAAQLASELFSAHQISKHYLAIVRGYSEESAVIDYALCPQQDAYSKTNAEPIEQAAMTRYTRLAQAELPISVGRYSTARYSLVSLEPVTGRKHQLRRHMKHIFHPIIGDTSHGDGRHNQMFRENFGSHRLLLAATRLKFTHPYSGKNLDLVASPGLEFEQVASRLGWDIQCYKQ